MAIHQTGANRLSPAAWLALVAGLGAALAAGRAQAQDSSRAHDASYVGLLLVLGLGGEADAEISAAGLTASGEDDLEPSFGGALTWMHPLHRHFVLGAQFGALSWQTEAGDAANADRNFMLDALIVPQARLPVSDAVELTLSLPLGLLLDFAGESATVTAMGMTVASADVPPAVGFEVGLLLGARFFVSSDVGLIAQLGYVGHFFEHEIEVSALGATASTSVDFALGQPRLQLGVAF